MRTLFTFLPLIVCLFWSGTSFGQSQPKSSSKVINPSDTFPVPKTSKDLLFYIQRTLNKNTIVYELNYNNDSTLNIADPVKVYWIRYSDKGEIAPLSYIQKNYAYGIESTITDSVKKTFRLRLVSYKKRNIYLIRAESDKRYHAYIMVNNKLVYFQKAFAKIEGGTFWLPHVTSVELTGKDPRTGKPSIEIIIP